MTGGLRRWSLSVAALAGTAVFAQSACAQPTAAEPALARSISAQPARPQPGEQPNLRGMRCADEAITARLATMLASDHFLDAHSGSVALRLWCGAGPLAQRWALLDAIALLHLDERARARDLLYRNLAARDRSVRQDSAQVLALSFLEDEDLVAFRASLRHVAPQHRLGLTLLAHLEQPGRFAVDLQALPDPRMRARIADLAASYHDARDARAPWLAVVLSAVLPGAGQAYAGSFQAAAVSLVLNGIFIAATVELASRGLVASAVASGLGVGFFYVGGLVNAADLAHKRNNEASREHLVALQTHLVPAAWPGAPLQGSLE